MASGWQTLRQFKNTRYFPLRGYSGKQACSGQRLRSYFRDGSGGSPGAAAFSGTDAGPYIKRSRPVGLRGTRGGDGKLAFALAWDFY